MESFSPVSPCAPAAPYLGGKSKLADQIVSLINLVPHNTYAEVFVGMGGIFLRRNYAPKSEVINDYSRDVSNFFRILQHHFVPFMDMLKWQITSRAEFERLVAVDPETLTDMQRAARFIYLQRLAFGGKIKGQSFGTDPGRPARFDVTKLSAVLEDIHERIARVVIERLDWKVFLERYDYPECLFYLDPPYFQSESDYGRDMFSREDFPVMAEKLAGLEGKFILSLNDHPAVRDIFRQFHIIMVETVYSVGGGDNALPVKEVLITNAHEYFKRGDLFG